jgi:hypothetical protein
LTEAEWLHCDFPYDMLRHLDGKIDDKDFMRFSVGCCRRVWPLITDPRSRAVVEATEAYLAGTMSPEAAGGVYAEWDRASQEGEVQDRAGWHTDQAIESVCGVGFGHAANVAMACFESAGYAASEPVRMAGAPQPEITAAWKAAELAERRAQCELLRQLFPHRPTKDSGNAEPADAAERPRD